MVFWLCADLTSLLTDDGLSVVTSNVMESDSITIKVVQDSNTELISLSVIWLSSSSSSSMRPVDIGIGSATWPGNTSSAHSSTSPEIFLALSGHQASELPLFRAVVNTDGSHPIWPTKRFPCALCEGGAAQSPADKVVATLEVVVGGISSPASSTAPSASWPATTWSPSTSTKKIVEESKLRRWNWKTHKAQNNNTNLHYSTLIL